MNSKQALLPLVTTSLLMMGLGVPSCPGQQAMQQQIDSIKTEETELKMKMQAVDTQLKALKEDLEQTKALVAPMSLAAKDQAASIERLDSSIKALETSFKSMSAKPATAKSKSSLKRK